MPVELERFDEGVRLRLTGHYTLDEALALIGANLDHKVFVFDIVKSKEIRSYDELIMLAEQIGSQGSVEKLAVISAQAFRFALSRQFTTMLNYRGIEAMAFQDEEEMWKWIGSGKEQ